MRYYYQPDGTVLLKASVRGSVIQPSTTLPWIDDVRDLDPDQVRVNTETLQIEIITPG